MAKVIVLPVDLSAEVSPGESLLDAGEKVGVEMEAGCFDCSCGACAVQVVGGMAALVPPSPAELEVLQRWERDPAQFRLACCTRLAADAPGPIIIRQLD